MAIVGTHALLYTSEPEALRASFRDVFGWRHVDAGGGWLSFALPPAELGVHPAKGPTYESGVRHQPTFMCDDMQATIRDLRARGIEVKGEPEVESFGITVMLGLPGGVEVMLYEPRRPVAIAAADSCDEELPISACLGRPCRSGESIPAAPSPGSPSSESPRLAGQPRGGAASG